MTRKAARSLDEGGPFAYLAGMIIALMLALAAPDQADAPVAAYAACLVAQAERLDDGKSDATTIAQIVRLECRRPERAAALALSGDNAFENRESVVMQIEAGGLTRAIRAVLRVRTAATK